jgi:hypothetical protein
LSDIVSSFLAAVRSFTVHGALAPTREAQRLGTTSAARDRGLLDDAVVAMCRPPANVSIDKRLLHGCGPSGELTWRMQEIWVLVPRSLPLGIQIWLLASSHTRPKQRAFESGAVMKAVKVGDLSVHLSRARVEEALVVARADVCLAWNVGNLVGDLPLQLCELPLALLLQAVAELNIVLHLLELLGKVLAIVGAEAPALRAGRLVALSILRRQIDLQAFPKFRPLLSELVPLCGRQHLLTAVSLALI